MPDLSPVPAADITARLDDVIAKHLALWGWKRTDKSGRPYVADGVFVMRIVGRPDDAGPVEKAIEAALDAKPEPITRAELIEFMHVRNGFDYDHCDHGQYSGGPLAGVEYAMCERQGDALADRLGLS